MTSALSIAAGGMRAATVHFESAARDLVRAGTEAQEALRQVSDPALSGGAPVSVPALEYPSLTASLVSLKQAEISFKASATVFEVASRLEGEVLDIIA